MQCEILVFTLDSIPIRAQRLLTAAGVASSRRHAETLLAAGRVSLNTGATLHLGASLPPADAHLLRVDGVPLTPLPPTSPLLGSSAKLYAFHKPRGYLSAWRDFRAPPRGTLADALCLRGAPPPASPRLLHAGRLDLDSEGLLLLTTCGQLALRVAHPSLGCVKRYLAVAAPLRPGAHALGGLPGALRAGVALVPESVENGGGERSQQRPAAASAAALLGWEAAESAFSRCGAGALGRCAGGAAVVSLALNDGRRRVVRRMMEALGWRVQRLLRVAVGSVELGALPAGAWEEVAAADFDGVLR